jgi:RNA polymerase sigma-70 factor (ECF subfamily)
MRTTTAASGIAEIDGPTMAAATAGDQAAFARIVAHYDPRLRALAWRLLGDRDAMDDALQEAYVRAYRSLHSFRHGSAPGTWLHRITYNVCIDELRRRQRRPTSPFDDLTERPHPGADPGTAVAERSRLASALATLPAEQRAAVLLVDAQGYDYADAGEILGIPAGTVASRLSRARAILRSALAEPDLGGLR